MNSAAVPVILFLWKFEISLALIIFLSAALGAIIAALLGIVKQFKTNKEVKKCTNENQELILANQKLVSENETITEENKNISEKNQELMTENKRLNEFIVDKND